MNRFFLRNPLSLLTVFVLFMLVVYLRFYFPVRNIISWDVFGYYLYLPAIFIHHDLGLKNTDWVYQLIEQYGNTSTFYQAFPGPEGTVVMKYSCGMAVVYSPFFFAAHLLAPGFGFAADGLSLPYQYAMVVAGLFYTLLGMILFRKLLLKFFGDTLSSLLLLLVIAGTNYLEMAYAGGLLSHNILFALYALTLLLTIRWYDRPGKGIALALGCTAGLITLIRPTDMIIILIPLLWGITGWSAMKERIGFLKKEYQGVLFFILGMIVMGLPQIVYWKLTTGKFIYYSYINPGEGFDFLFPHTLNYLFSFRKGWLIYTPVMLLAIAGIVILFKRKREIYWPVVVFLTVYLYVVSSWSCWWYAGSFSARSMVQTYPVLAIPLGFFFLQLKDLRLRKRVLLYALVVFFLSLNLFQLWQYSFRWIIDPYRMTMPYYWRVFGKTTANPEDRKLLLVERSAEAVEYLTDTTGYSGRTLFYMDFELDKKGVESKITDTLAHSGNSSLVMDSTLIFSPGLNIKFKDITKKDHAWLRVSVWVYSPDDPEENPLSLVVSFMHKGGNYKYRTIDLDNPGRHYKAGTWNFLTMDYMTPEVRTRRDNLSVYCWLRGKNPVLIDDLSVEVFEPEPAF